MASRNAKPASANRSTRKRPTPTADIPPTGDTPPAPNAERNETSGTADARIHDFYQKAVAGFDAATLQHDLAQKLQLLAQLQAQALHLLPGPMQSTAFQTEVAKAMGAMLAQMATHPREAVHLQVQFTGQWTALWAHFWQRMAGLPEAEAAATPDLPKPDRRFAAAAWQANPVADFLRHAYLINAQAWQQAVQQFAPDDPAAARKLQFYVKQTVDAMSPANYATTNPEVWAQALETRGDSLVQGMRHLLDDLRAGRVSMTDSTAFEVGRNVAVTPGQVVFENRLCQLIQYAPTTEQVYAMPLLILPPWINKYYILDLSPETSLIRYLVAQGFTVFIVSWKNIGPDEADITWEDYLQLGGLDTLQAVLDISGQAKTNVIGYCIGGTLLACLLSILKSRNADIVNCAAFFTAMVDFSDTGDISVFVDEAQQREREDQLARGGVFSGNAMANAFAFLRANDLVYNYVVNNYLLGRHYIPFDLLYWNSDPCNLPGPMYVYYLRNMYLENNLVKPGKLHLLGHAIDVGQVTVPVLSICTREDHIAPWHTVYRGAKAFGGPVEVVLGASGHIAGVVNPPEKKKREYWYGGDLRGDHEHWLATAQNEKGSWWPYLVQYLQRYNKQQVPARTQLGSAQHSPIEPAPGRYVREQLPPTLHL